MPFKDRPFFRRILEFHDLMLRRRPVTCRSLAQRWETSAKTAQRFIDQMRDDLKAPIEFDPKRQTYFYTNPEYRLPWLPIEGKDLFAIGVAMKVLQIYEGTPAAADLKVIFDRLSEFMPPEVRIRPSSLLEKLYLHPQPFREMKPAVWVTVANALREKTVLEIEYRKLGMKAQARTVEPFCLMLAATGWLLEARDPEDDEVKTFYLSRMVEAHQTNRRFTMPASFDPAKRFGESIGIYRGGGTFPFRVRFSPEVAEWVAEAKWHPKQKLTRLAGGEIELELPTQTLWEARRFVLSFGHFAQALSPVELVEDIKREVREIAALYREARR